MSKQKIEFYAIVSDRRNDWERRQGYPLRLAVHDIRQNKPRLERNEIAVKVVLGIESALFEEFIPTVSADIAAPHIHAPEAEVELEQVEPIP